MLYFLYTMGDVILVLKLIYLFMMASLVLCLANRFLVKILAARTIC